MNQYTSRTVPGGVDVIGTANASSTVTVNDQPTYRKGEYFWRELAIGNEWVPVYQSITNLAVLNDSPNPDIVSNRVGHVLLSKTPETFLHDHDGNLVQDGLWTNIWNGENRLVRTESLSTVPEGARARVDWTYLPDGRWIERVVSTWVGGDYVPQSTNRFVWDGQVLLGILGEDNAATLSFMRGLDLSGTMQGAGGVGGLLAVTDHTASETHFVGNDGNGNVTLLVGAADGIESARYAYSSFGETLRATGDMAKKNPIRFSTQFTDHVTGDAKYLFREYRPATGRWLNRDPLGDEAFFRQYSKGKSRKTVNELRKEALGNPYRFVNNDPVDNYDAFGLKVQICCRNIDVNPVANAAAWLVQAKHCWVKTDTKAAGMGPANGGPLPASPCCGTLTAITDHSNDKAVKCFDIPGADENCVNNALQIGTPLGDWKFSKNCNTFATDIVKGCGGKNHCLKWVTVEGPEFGEFTFCQEWAVPLNLLLPYGL